MIEYALGRIHGRRVHLLGRHGLTELAAQPDLAARIELLRRSGHLPAGLSTTREVARALRLGLALDVARVDRWLEGNRQGKLVRAVVSAASDSFTLKTILRGVERGEPSTRLLELVAPTFEFDEGALKELVAQRTVKELLDLLTTWRSPLAAPLGDTMAARKFVVDLPAIETAIDRFLLGRALALARHGGLDGELTTAVLSAHVDMLNVAILVRLSGTSAIHELFIPGGVRLGRERFEKLGRLGAREAHAALAADRGLELGAAVVGGRIDPFRLDRLAQRRLLAPLRRPALEHPLSVAVPLLYILERQEEARAIRLILEAGELGLRQSEVLDLIEGAGAAA